MNAKISSDSIESYLKSFHESKICFINIFRKEEIERIKIKLQAAFVFLNFFSNYYVQFHIAACQISPRKFFSKWKKQFSEQNSNINYSVFEHFFFFAKFISQIFGPFKLFANLLGKRKVFFSFIFILNDAN